MAEEVEIKGWEEDKSSVQRTGSVFRKILDGFCEPLGEPQGEGA